MKIGIIDAEIIGKKKHRFPNLCCMKISAYHKNQGDDVELLLSYDDISLYDKVYISKVFVNTNLPNEIDAYNKNEENCHEYYSNNDIVNLPNVIVGGTGFFYDKAEPLPYEIEHCMPDYELYSDWIKMCVQNNISQKQFKYYTDYSIGYLTRGCFRRCKFCVNRNYTQCKQHSDFFEFFDKSKKKACFLDDNFFACPNWKEIIKNVKNENIRFQFKQGLDERLLTDEKIEEMLSWKYDGDYIFAFDNFEEKEIIISKLNLLCKYIPYSKRQKIKFYVFTGYDRDNIYDYSFYKKDIINLFARCNILKSYNVKPYIMRHENYVNSPYRGTYINVAAWVNQPNIFFTHTYTEFCKKDDERRNMHGNSSTWRYYTELITHIPLELLERSK